MKLSTPDTRDLPKTKTGKLLFDGFQPARRICPGMWVGSVMDSADAAFMTRNDIRAVVNCSKNLPFRFPEQRHIRLPVDDAFYDTLPLFVLWKTAVPRIDALLSNQKRVLVHCYAGVQRSAATAAAVLMYRHGLSADEAIARGEAGPKLHLRP